MENTTFQLDYEVYDRQLVVFCNTAEALVHGWHEYSATELSMDLQSLCVKGARLCFMADQDAIWQQEDLTHSRRALNKQWCEALRLLLTDQLAPMIDEVIRNFQQGVPFSGVTLPCYKGEFADILPHLQASICEDGTLGETDCQLLMKNASIMQEYINKTDKKARQKGETPVRRFWSLAQVYALACYLYYHFQKLTANQQLAVDESEAGRLLVRAIQNYTGSQTGQHALKTFQARLFFENDGRQPSQEQLNEAGKSLVSEIPKDLQYCYMAFRNEPAKMAAEILSIHPTQEELRGLLEAVAKWQWLQEMIYQLDHPGKALSPGSSIFNVKLNGRAVDMQKLREAIARMARKVTYKNQWFCVWCVLKHRNLLADYHFQAFADQMMHPDWLGNEHVPHFSGENISDYSEYLGQTDFTLWTLKAFRDYRVLHGKPEKKWSDTLFNTFLHLCYEMDECLAAVPFC